MFNMLWSRMSSGIQGRLALHHAKMAQRRARKARKEITYDENAGIPCGTA